MLTCYTGLGECSRMTQFKEKSLTHSENVNVGLFAYPVLQAADILLYQADLVPVGEDQKQHLELTRNIAQRFNFNYSDTFKLPEAFIPKIGARIMSLQAPTTKMSKSDENSKNVIYLTDTNAEIINKIKKSVTDSDSEIKRGTEKHGIVNLMTLLSVSTGKTYNEIEKDFEGKSYGEFKLAVGEAVADFITPIREKYLKVREDKGYLEKIMAEGAEKANKIATKTLREVSEKIGLILPINS
jgi:tryptophanyl-tRNA synthetase